MSLIQMSFSGTIMILAVIAVRALAINRLSKKVFVLLWEIIIVRLLVPFSIPSVFSAYSLVGRSTPVQNTPSNTPVGNMIPQAADGQININVGTAQVMESNISAVSVWQVIWFAGVILCAAFFVVSYLRCYAEFKTSLPVHNEFASRWLKEHPLIRTVQIRQSDRISAPLTYGIFKPVVLMPKKTDWRNEEQLQYVLLHEYMHIRYFDMIGKLIAAAALCIHWFNPMVWVMYILMNRDIELSCDERVVRQSGDISKSAYAKTLITMEEKRSGLASLYNNFSKTAIEKRITAIMKTKKRTVWAVMAGAIILVAVIVLFATSAENRVASNNDGGMAEEGTEAERIEAGQAAEEGTEAERIEAGQAAEEGTETLGIVMVEVNVPDVVLETAMQYTAQRFDNMKDGADGYSGYHDWRIVSLTHAYTYDELDGMTLQIYRMNYELLANEPDNVLLAGGASIDEEGWVVPEYPNSTYFVFRQEGEMISYLTSLFENDCQPGDEIFTYDLKRRLGLMEFEEDKLSGENYYITEETANGQAKELVQTMTSFYEAYFSRDKIGIMSHLVENYPIGIEVYENSEHVDGVEIKGIKGLSNISELSHTEQYTLSLEFVEPGEDSFTYLVVIFEYENDSWKVNFYGLEK